MNPELPTPPADLRQEDRPGVPMEKRAEPLLGVHWTRPERQPKARGVTHRPELDEMTAVFGTGQPLKGVSGLLRRLAYSVPETFVRHWALLLLADRIDVWESRAWRWGKRSAFIGALGFGGLLAFNSLRRA